MMYERFKTKATGAQAEVHRFPTRAAALDFLAGFLNQEQSADAQNATALVAASMGLADAERERLAACPGVHFDVTRERAAQAKIGISQMDWALADTGTLVHDATAAEERLVSTLPSIHIALVPSSGLHPDLPSLLAQVDPRRSRYLAFITGPSRTADIERVLTIGVHGPKRLVALFVDDLKARA